MKAFHAIPDGASLVFFTPEQYFDLPRNSLPSDIPLVSKSISKLDADKPLLAQIQIQPNVPYKLGDDLTILALITEPKFYAMTGTLPVRVGKLSNDHIKLKHSAATLTLVGDLLHVFDDENVYLNGKRIKNGAYPLEVGDCIWVGTTKITPHRGYLEIQSTGCETSLNIATKDPNKYEEFPVFKRPPRQIRREPTDSVDLNAPPDKEEAKKGVLIKMIVPPLASAGMMIAFGLLLGRGIMMLMSAGMMVVAVANSIFTFFSDRKTRREKGRERENDYNRYLLAKRKELQKLQDAQRESLTYHNLSPKEIEREILNNSSRVYERASGDADFLTLSLGFSDTPISYSVKTTGSTEKKRDPLYEEMQVVVSRHHVLKDMPTVIDLKHAHLGLVGEKLYIHRTLASILTQLCFFQSYHDIEIIVLTEEEDRGIFEWIRWYPHCKIKSINVTGLISAENHRDQALGNISQMMKQRQQKAEESKKDSRFLPHYIFITDNPKLIVNHSIMEFLQAPDTALGFSLIYATHLQANLPENIKTVFRLDGGDHGTLIMNEGNLVQRPVTLPSLGGIGLEMMARKLAPLRHMQGISTQIPERVSFFGLYGVKRPEEIPVLQLWNKNACHKSLSVPLGLRGREDVVALNLHENAHGPHGLVAGTTGSGKSEIVQSYILSLAVNFHPHEVGFLLIDYKGGGMANLFENLPHLLGTITNLDGSESMRALASIKSELKRRQAIFGDVGVNNINQYTKLFKAGEATLPMPHLFIISDEFAELKKEQPEFMAELVSTARIGRSLGVHLILATQKPSGVVDDQIWSNSKFKLALKVANESDSNEVLKTPDAARITQAGRAYLQVGNNEIYELFQSAWSGAPFVEDVVDKGFDSRVYEINQLGQGVLLNEDLSEVDQTREAKFTELDVTVDHVQAVYASLNSAAVARPWLPPLEQKIVTEAIKSGHDVGQIEGYHLDVPLGMVDIPERQEQKEFKHNFPDDGNLAIFGASGFGKSTSLMTIALTIASNNSPQNAKLFVLDYGNSALAQLRGLPHVADYLTIDDGEKLEKLIKLFAEEIKLRKHRFASVNAMNFRMYNEVAKEKLPAVFLVIDNFDVVREVREDLEEVIKGITRDGPSIGLYTVITASRGNAIKYSVISNFKNKITTFMNDKSEVTSIVGRSNYELPEVRGRALIRLADVHVAQMYLPVPHENDIDYANRVGALIAEIDEKNTSGKASGVRILPDVITFAEIAPYFSAVPRQAILGFDTETTEPLGLDLTIPFQVVVGGAATGKTNLLRILLRQFTENRVFVSDSQAADLHAFAENETVTYLGSADGLDAFIEQLGAEVVQLEAKRAESGQNPREFIASQPPTLVLIDDGDHFVDLSKAKAAEVEALIKKGAELGVVCIATTMGAKLKGYDPITGLFKNPQAVVALGSPDEAGAIVPSLRAPRGYKPSPEVGFWFKRGDLKKIKLPFVE